MDKYKFLLEVDNDRIPINDMAYTIHKLLPFILFWNKIEMLEAKVKRSELPFISVDDPCHIIPIGTVDFVFDYLKKYVDPLAYDKLRPLNIPECLMRYAEYDGVMPETIMLDESSRQVLEFKYKGMMVNVKPASHIKSSECVERVGLAKVKDGLIQITKHRNILSEYRCFVYKDNIFSMRHYAGDPFIAPSLDTAKEMVRVYSKDPNRPPAYALDISIDADGKTRVVEANYFFSLALYGEDMVTVPYAARAAYLGIASQLKANAS